jgi:hypothetical protein
MLQWERGGERKQEFCHEAQSRSLDLASKGPWACGTTLQEKRGRNIGIKTQGKKERKLRWR